MSNKDGDPCSTLLYGALRNPLQSITNCYLRIKKLDGSNIITGMIVDDDCVELNNDFLQTIKPPVSEEKVSLRKESISMYYLFLHVRSKNEIFCTQTCMQACL